MNDSGYDGGLGLTQPAVGAQRLETLRHSIAGQRRLWAGRIYSQNASGNPPGQSSVGRRPNHHPHPTNLGDLAAARSSDGVVVAYEADSIDPQTRTGWSVVVTGRAYTIADPDQVSRYEQLLHPWVNHADTVVAIEPGSSPASAPLPRAETDT